MRHVFLRDQGEYPSRILCPLGICTVCLERAPKRTKGLGTGFEGQESVCFSGGAVQSWGRQCLCKPQASTPVWGSLIHERDPVCSGSGKGMGSGSAHPLPDPARTQLFSSGGWLIYLLK